MDISNGTRMNWLMKKTGSKKSCETVPLRIIDLRLTPQCLRHLSTGESVLDLRQRGVFLTAPTVDSPVLTTPPGVLSLDRCEVGISLQN